jgi:predicted AlkP superfamily pyrophosphatase or phosphodiesterase
MLNALTEHNSILHHSVDKAILFPLTSTFASTTPTALASLSTGLTPQQHAITGYSIYLKQLGIVANMVNFSPSTEQKRDSLMDAGVDPSQFLGAKTLHEIFNEEGYRSHVVTRWTFRNSALTRMLHKGANLELYVDTSDLFIKLKRLIESNPSEESYILAYWDTLDTTSHVYGPKSEEVEAAIRNLFFSLKTEFLDRVNKDSTKKTILLVASDHGHHTFDKEKTVNILDHKQLFQDLQIQPTGSSRAPYLYPKLGRLESVKDYLSKHFGDCFHLLESKEALKQGLFGRGEISDQTLDRIGELLALPKEGTSLYYPYRPHKSDHVLKGGHGGLMEDEMMVPLLILKLK